jgi:membrane protein DedA with SNARE-associated domain
MSEPLLNGIAHYGYFAIFLFVLIQETGLPSPLPNEYVLFFSGYLASTGVLHLYYVILAVVAADLIAGFLLYELFFHSGKLILQKRPKWIPIPFRKLARLSIRLRKSRKKNTFIGRLTPFIRGWVSVLSGLMQLPQKEFSIVLISTSILWASAYVCTGFLLGPYYKQLMQHNILLGIAAFALPLVVLILFRVLKQKKISILTHKV